VLRLFALDLIASDGARLTGLSVCTANNLCLRRRLQQLCPVPADLNGSVELDELYFGPRRVRGKRGAGGKMIIFGLFKRGGQLYTEIVPDCSKQTLQGVIRGKVDVAAMVNTAGWRGYYGLVNVGFDRYSQVRHGQNEFGKVSTPQRYRVVLELRQSSAPTVRRRAQAHLPATPESV
jgi:transposase-like protein